jgi:hypothetical protein
MDFFKIIRSLEELLYETITWLIFYPLTLWRCITRPEALMAYTTEELREEGDGRFSDLMSPPLFLMLSVLIAHGLEMLLRLKPEEADATMGEMGRMIVESEQNLLLYRSFLFALFPLVTAAGILRRKKLPLDRVSMRGPFFQQCYFAAPYGLAVSSASALLRDPRILTDMIGAALFVVGTGWYLWVQSRWVHRELEIGKTQAAGLALWMYLAAAIGGSLLGIAILRL